MRIRSVKLLTDRVTLAWETPVGEHGEVVESAIKNGEGVTPELANAVAALKDDVCEILEFPKGYRDTFTMKGLSVSYGADGGRGVTFTGSKKLKSGRATTINTPEIKERQDHEEKGTGFMTDELAGRVGEVIQHAEAYANGARAQTTLALAP
jgi:hypothetical protein